MARVIVTVAILSGVASLALTLVRSVCVDASSVDAWICATLVDVELARRPLESRVALAPVLVGVRHALTVVARVAGAIVDLVTMDTFPADWT